MMKYTPKSKSELQGLTKDKNIYLGDIDTSQITDMSSLFYKSNRKDFTGIEDWDVSNVTDMASMFSGRKNFNRSLNNWNVSKVQNVLNVFSGCTKFNQPLIAPHSPLAPYSLASFTLSPLFISPIHP